MPLVLHWKIFLMGGGLVFLYVVYIVVSAFLDTKGAPRKPMMWCQKHGAILEEHMIDFVGQKVCSICFHEKLKAAENTGKR